MSRYNNPREYKNEIAKYIEVLSDLRREIDNLMNDFPKQVLIWRADLCERENKLDDIFELDLIKYPWNIWAELEDARDNVIKVAGQENYDKYIKHMKSFEELEKWMNGEE